MTFRSFLYTGNRYSESGKLVARGLGIPRIKTEGSKYRPRYSDVIINWGSSTLIPNVSFDGYINHPEKVRAAVNKLHCFEVLGGLGVSIPEYTTRFETVQALVRNGETWLARTNVTGSGGDGIVVLSGNVDIPYAPLYVQYVPKKYEVRIHVADGKAFDWQQKMNAVGQAQQNWMIRSHGNGFVFARNDTTIPEQYLELCEQEAIAAVDALGLDFGAVDVVFNERRNKAYVLEVNTAPGLENTTLDNYVQMFKEEYGTILYNP